METSDQLTKLKGLTSLPEDSHAKISALPDSGGESTESEADYGQSLPESLGEFDPATYSLRTSQGCLLTNQCEEFLATFPRSGTMRNGKVFQRPPLVPLTYATGFGYLPTPDKSTGLFSAKMGGRMIRGNAQTCFQKEMFGQRPSGAKIGSSLVWCPEYIRESLRTGGSVNPSWLAVLMGFPEDWWTLPTECSETQLCPKLPNGSGGESSKPTQG